MIDIEKVREALDRALAEEFYDIGTEYNMVNEAITELERLQKREVEMKEVIRKYQVENDNLHSWGVASTILDRFLKELESDEK